MMNIISVCVFLVVWGICCFLIEKMVGMFPGRFLTSIPFIMMFGYISGLFSLYIKSLIK